MESLGDEGQGAAAERGGVKVLKRNESRKEEDGKGEGEVKREGKRRRG